MNTLLDIINTLDAIFTVQAGLVFALVTVCVLAVMAMRKPAVVTHYMRTDMVDMVLSADEYNVFLQDGDIRGEWKPVLNGKLLPLDAGVLESYTEMCAAYAEEAEAHYAQEALDNEVVECAGMCLCENLYVFTTTNKLSADVDYCTMIACNHCPVCNPDGIVELYDVEVDGPTLEVASMYTTENAVHFTFNDGSRAKMRPYTFEGCTTQQLDAPSEGGYYVENIHQARAIDAFTGTDCIPF